MTRRKTPDTTAGEPHRADAVGTAPGSPDTPTPLTFAGESALDDLRPGDIAAARAEEPPLWLDHAWHAACPLPGFSGAVRFPPVLDLPRYRHWLKLTEAATDDDRDPALAFVYVGDSPALRAFPFSILYYRSALAFADITLTRQNETAVDPADLAALPFALVAWLALTAKYWLEAQMTFRLVSR